MVTDADIDEFIKTNQSPSPPPAHGLTEEDIDNFIKVNQPAPDLSMGTEFGHSLMRGGGNVGRGLAGAGRWLARAATDPSTMVTDFTDLVTDRISPKISPVVRGGMRQAFAALPGAGTLGLLPESAKAFIRKPTETAADQLDKASASFGKAFPPSESLNGVTLDLTNPRWWVGRLPEQAAQLAAAVGVGLVTKNPMLATSIAGAQQLGSVRAEAKDYWLEQGLDEKAANEMADREATVIGLPTAAMEKIPLDAILGKLPGGKEVKQKFVSRLLGRGARGLKAAAAEGGTEVAQGSGEDLGAWLFRDQKVTPAEFAKRRAAEFALGAAIGGPLGVVAPAAGAHGKVEPPPLPSPTEKPANGPAPQPDMGEQARAKDALQPVNAQMQIGNEFIAGKLTLAQTQEQMRAAGVSEANIKQFSDTYQVDRQGYYQKTPIEEKPNPSEPPSPTSPLTFLQPAPQNPAAPISNNQSTIENSLTVTAADRKNPLYWGLADEQILAMKASAQFAEEAYRVDAKNPNSKPQTPNNSPTQNIEIPNPLDNGVTIKTDEANLQSPAHASPLPDPSGRESGAGDNAGAQPVTGRPGGDAVAGGAVAANPPAVNGGEANVAGTDGGVVAGTPNQPAAPELTAPHPVSQPKSKNFTLPYAPLGAPDVLDFIGENGGIVPRETARRKAETSGRALGAEYDGYNPENIRGIYRRAVFGEGRGGTPVDVMAQMAYDGGQISEPTPDALFDAVNRGIKTRRIYREEELRQRRAGVKQERQWKNFVKDTKKQKGTKPVSVNSLLMDDIITVRGERLRVAAIDPDDLSVTLEDGEKYGAPRVEDGEILYVERYWMSNGRNTKSATPTQTEHGKKIQRETDRVFKGARNAPEIIVVDTPQDTPDDRGGLLSQRPGNRLEGYYYDGKVYLIAGNLKNSVRGIEIALHEIVGHHGLRGLLGENSYAWNTTMDAVYAAIKDKPLDPRIATRAGYQSLKELAAAYGFELDTAEGRRALAEEVLARMAEFLPVQRSKQPTWFRRALTALRNAVNSWLRGRVVLTDADILELLRASHRYVQTGARGAYGAAPAAGQTGAAASKSARSPLTVNGVAIPANLTSDRAPGILMSKRANRLPGADDEGSMARMSDPQRAAIQHNRTSPAGGLSEARLAANGQPSKLTAEEYARATSPEFKARHGDWEALGHRQFLDGEPVKVLTGDEFKKDLHLGLTERVEKYYQSLGGVANSPVFGAVKLNKAGVKSSIAHGVGRNKAAAFAAVPEVIERGRVIDRQENWKGRGHDTAVVAAPLQIAGENYVAAVVLKLGENSNQFYLHEVYLKKKLQEGAPSGASSARDVFKTGGVATNVDPSSGSDSIIKLLRNIYAVNPENIKIPLDENGEPVMREATADGDQGHPDRQRPNAGTPPLAARRAGDLTGRGKVNEEQTYGGMDTQRQEMDQRASGQGHQRGLGRGGENRRGERAEDDRGGAGRPVTPQHFFESYRAEDAGTSLEFGDGNLGQEYALYNLARKNGWLIPDERINQLRQNEYPGGMEHRIFRDREHGRIYKLTRPGRWGVMGSPKGYLQSIAAFAQAAPKLDARVEGVWLIGDEPTVLTSYHQIAGEKPHQVELNRYLREKGWKPQGDAADSTYVHQSGVKMLDAHVGNFIKAAGGELYPIDVHFDHTDAGRILEGQAPAPLFAKRAAPPELREYRALTRRKRGGESLTVTEERRLLDLEKSLGQRTAFDMDLFDAKSEPSPPAVTPRAEFKNERIGDGQGGLMLGGAEEQGGQFALFAKRAKPYDPAKGLSDREPTRFANAVVVPPALTALPAATDRPVRVIDVADDVLKGDRIIDLRVDARKKLTPQFGRRFKNADTGWEILFNRRTLGHLFKHEGAVNVHAALAVPDIIRHAVLVTSEAHEPVTADVKQVHKLAGALNFRGETYGVALTVKEHTDHLKHHAYDIEALTVKKSDPAKVFGTAPGTAGAELRDALNAGSEINLSQLGEEFNQKVGSPLASKRAYHGTPHRVGKFRTVNIGSGEGSQAYGWGLYFAENQATGEEYRKNLSGREIKLQLDGQPILAQGNPVWNSIRERLATKSRNYRGALRENELREYIQLAIPDNDLNEQVFKREQERLLKLLDDGRVTAGIDSGKLYRVELNVEDDELLDWDYRIEAYDAVLEKLKDLDYFIEATTPDALMPKNGRIPLTGEQFYGWLANKLGKPKASEWLASKGIKGIRYLDLGSRFNGWTVGENEGKFYAENYHQGKSHEFPTRAAAQKFVDKRNAARTRNYVIFDENDITITHENGAPVSALLASKRANRLPDADGDGSISGMSDPQRAANQHNRTSPAGGFSEAAPRLAANGQPSNLTAEEYARATSPEFKARYGDWEALAKRDFLAKQQPVVFSSGLPEDKSAARNLAEKIYPAGKIFKNHASGRLIKMVKSGFRKLKSHSADLRTLRLIPGLKELIEQAIPIFESVSDGATWHHYAVAAKIDGEALLVRLVAFEGTEGDLRLDIFHDGHATPREMTEGSTPNGRSPHAMQDFRGIDPSKDKLLQWWHSVNPADIKISLDENSEPVMREATADGDQARPDHQRPHAGTPPLAAKRVRDDSRENVTDPAQAGRSYMDEVANPIAADATVARLNAEVNDLAQRVAAAETGDAAQAEAVMRALEQRQDELRRAVARVVESNPEKLRLESRLGALEEALHNEPVLRGLDENLLRAQITEAKAELAAVMARLEEQANFLTGGEPPIDETKAGDEFRYGPQVPALWKPVGWTRFFKGASDILLATPGLEFLGRAVKRHVDLARKHQGHHTAPFLAWQRKFNRKERRQGFKDFEAYFTEVDAPVIERTAGGGTRKRGKTAAERAAVSAEGYSPAGRELIKRWQDGALAMHQKNRAVKLVVWDGQEQRFRPIGTIANYFPRTLKPEIRRVLQDPTSNKKLFDKITTELLNGGFIKRAEDALKFLSARFSGESSFDYFANIEAGRETPLPTMMYDYSFNAARRYLMSWCERVAQVEAYGQKVGAQGKDLFDIAQSGTYNQATKEYIEAVRQRAYGVTSKGVWARGAAVLNALATATQLSNPITVLTNLTSGLAYNATTIGFIPAVKGAWQMRGMMRDASIIAEAGEHGAILDDLMNMVSDMEALDSPAVNAAQQVAQFGLKWSGFNASERFVRTHSYLTAKSFLRDALKSWGGDTNHQSRRARLYEAWFERNGFDVDALRMENGTGEETGRFLRGAVNLAQGGYRFDQVPVFMDTPAGRFFFKYQKWGTQMAANFVRNAWNPAFNPGKDRNGQARPRDVMPLIGYLIITAALGAGLDELYEKIFGRAKRGASWSEIGNTLDDDALKALGMVASKIFQQQLVCGAYGAFGNYAQSMQDFAARSKFKSPLDPPGLATVKNVGELVMRLWEQDGRLTAADIDDIMAGQARAYATGKAALARALSVADADIAWQQNELARQDAAWLNSVTRRYADELGVQNRRMGFTRIGKTPQSRHYDAVHRALLRGDGEAARAAVVEYLAGYADSAARQTALKSLAASVRGRQPVKVGGSAGYEREQLFLEWAQKNLAPADVARIQEINRRYKETATRMGLMKPGGNMPLSPRQLREAERRINWRTRTSSYRTVPEQPAALAAQLRLVADGRKPALLVPKGTPDTVRENALALGLREAVTVAGTFYYNPDQVKRTELRRAALNNTIGEVLGYGIAAKPDERDAIGAVTVRGPDGAEKFSVATDRKNLTKVARAAGRLVDDGDVVDLEPVPAVLARRLAFPSREGVGAERTG